MPAFNRDGLSFHYRESSRVGTSFVFQHGLGGDASQTFGIFNPPDGIRMITLDFRGHGETYPAGSRNGFGIHQFADDLRVFLDHLRISKAIIGGISLGAAVTLNFALRFPSRVVGLALSRPAWLNEPSAPNLQIYDLIADLIRTKGVEQGLETFLQTPQYASIEQESPDAAASLVGQFRHPRATEALARIECLPLTAPFHDFDELHRFTQPVLVLANRRDPIHPYEYGVTLADAFPAAIFREITPKSDDKARHTVDVQHYLQEFLLSLLNVQSVHSSS